MKARPFWMMATAFRMRATPIPNIIELNNGGTTHFNDEEGHYSTSGVHFGHLKVTLIS